MFGDFCSTRVDQSCHLGTQIPLTSLMATRPAATNAVRSKMLANDLLNSRKVPLAFFQLQTFHLMCDI